MFLPILAVVLGLILLVWSADRFVDGAAASANHFGMPPLLIGMVVVGFGTSAPEMVISTISAWQGNPAIALGNAYGSNIANIGLILGLSAILAPIAVSSQVLRKELPLLSGITIISAYLLYDGQLTRLNALTLGILFIGVMGWTIFQGRKKSGDALGDDITKELTENAMTLPRALSWLLIGLLLLIVASRMAVWGAVEIAHAFGVSDLIIGLTIIALGTSLPELASSLVAAHKGESDLALGNILGSNLFNTLAVVAIAGLIHPSPVPDDLFSRDMLVTLVLTMSLFIMGYGFRGPGKGRINRFEGGLLLLSYCAYIAYIFVTMKN